MSRAHAAGDLRLLGTQSCATGRNLSGAGDLERGGAVVMRRENWYISGFDCGHDDRLERVPASSC
jgi:hypothetical protein